jgi:N-acetylglucosaminyl-diphospho-decaprenol L-rhamnosyltransferase
MPARVSLIVVSYRSASLAIEAIRSARAATSDPIQVIAVDNSVDGNEAEALRPHADVLLAPDRNLGYGAAINRARAKCDGDVLIAANADVIFEASSIDKLADADAEMAGPALFWDDAFKWFLPPSDLHTTAEEIDAAIASHSERWQRSRDRHRIRKRIAFWSLTAPTPVRAISGCVMAIRRPAFDRIGGFDERFHLYFEETDFQRRLGRGIVYMPQAHCRHIYNQSAGISDFAAAEYAKAEMQYLTKWSGAAPARWIKSFERPRPLTIYAPLDGDIPIDRRGLVVEASPLASFETSAGHFPASDSVAIPDEVWRAYRGSVLYIRLVDAATARTIRIFAKTKIET